MLGLIHSSTQIRKDSTIGSRMHRKPSKNVLSRGAVHIRAFVLESRLESAIAKALAAWAMDGVWSIARARSTKTSRRPARLKEAPIAAQALRPTRRSWIGSAAREVQPVDTTYSDFPV